MENFLDLVHYLKENNICHEPGCTTCYCSKYRAMLKEMGSDEIERLLVNTTLDDIKLEYSLDWHDALEVLLVDNKEFSHFNCDLIKAYWFVWDDYKFNRRMRLSPMDARFRTIDNLRRWINGKN